MLEIKIGLALSIFILVLVAFVRTKDAFSPVKFYLVYSIVFYLGIFTHEVRWETMIVYVALILSIAIAQILESGKNPFLECTVSVPRSIYSCIWVLTLPGILVKLYFIAEAGGIFEYLNSLAFRVEDWKGKGYLVVWFLIIPVLNLVYFSYLLVDSSRSTLRKLAYLFHFFVFISIGLLTGSRSFIAIAIVGMAVSYSYFRRQMSFAVLVSIIISVVTMASLIGAARNGLGGEDPEAIIETISSMESLDFQYFGYGVTPLELVFSSSQHEPHFGATYASLLTNALPRSLFPDKLETGGIVFTREYAGDEWGGLSHLATGSVTEGVLNFGLEAGIWFGAILNLVLMCLGVLWYNKMKSQRSHIMRNAIAFPIDLVIYFYFVLAAARISFGEFTDIFHTFLFYCLAPCVAVRVFAIFIARDSRENEGHLARLRGAG